MNTNEKKFREYCDARKLRVTPHRLGVYHILLQAQKPLTAYDVLSLISPEDANPKPPIAYRALEFLDTHGFAHRIESLNAYVACDIDHIHKGSQFMICHECDQVEEIHLCTLPDALDRKIKNEGFTLHHWNAEVHGTCSKCASS